MKAAYIDGHGGIDEIRVGDVAGNEPGAGEVRVAMKAAALNHLDLFVLAGLPGLELPMPHVLGADGAGVVDAVGEGVTDLQPGDEVVLNPGIWCNRCEYCLAGEQSTCIKYGLLGEHVDGTIAEAVVVPERNCHRKPGALSWVEAAAFPLVTLTAWRLLVTKARVQAGDTVLIHGIGGGVSLVAMQIAMLHGAKVFVTSHSEAKLHKALEMGASAALDYTQVDVAREVRELTGRRGVDIVVDNVGAATFESSVNSCRKGGCIVTCGATTGPAIPVDVRRLFWAQISIHGSTMCNEDEFRAMLGVVAAGGLPPVIDTTFPLDQTAAAFRRLQNAEQFGKLVIDIARP
jgi:NADPH:quinone reductase-like Zn-dependent oxidoreductase